MADDQSRDVIHGAQAVDDFANTNGSVNINDFADDYDSDDAMEDFHTVYDVEEAAAIIEARANEIPTCGIDVEECREELERAKPIWDVYMQHLKPVTPKCIAIEMKEEIEQLEKLVEGLQLTLGTFYLWRKIYK
jgi:hypothetical protein